MKPKLEYLLVLFFLVGIVLIFISERNQFYHAYAPKENETLENFLKDREESIKSVEVLVEENRTLTVVTLKMENGIFDIRSGPPIFIFNESGELVEWELDSGD